MSETTSQRRLAAILAADVVGYTRLVEQDTDGTVVAWKSARDDVIKPLVYEKSGHIIKFTGDGFLVEFPSVQDAVSCAITMQEQLKPSPLDFRIGLNVGDIVDDGGDVHGEGVNIAARLEALAEPGCICISGDVYNQVRNRIEASYSDMGEQKVKHVSQPVRVYSIGVSERSTSESPLPELPDKPSIAVLPFTNMSGDPAQEYFSDGITEDIITELSRFRSLFVMARNSSFTFKDQVVDVKEIGERLGVAYVVEGSVRRAGNRVRVTAQLIDAAASAHLWAERYDRDLDDIFTVQDEVTQAIVTAIEPALGSAERDRAYRKPTERLDAWESYQRGLWHNYRNTTADNAEAQSFFRRAIGLDPNFAPAHAGLAYAIYLSVLLGFGADLASAPGEARAAAQSALSLDGEDAVAHAVAGRAHIMAGEHDAAISACKTAVSLNPNLATARYGLATALIYSGRYETGIAEADEAIRLSPRDPMLWAFVNIKAMASFGAENYEEALELARAAQRYPDAGSLAYAHEVVALAHLDRISEARQAFERAIDIKPDFDMNIFDGVIKQMRPSCWELYIDAVKKLGMEH